MVVLKNSDFLRAMNSGLRPFWKQTLQLINENTNLLHIGWECRLV